MLKSFILLFSLAGIASASSVRSNYGPQIVQSGNNIYSRSGPDGAWQKDEWANLGYAVWMEESDPDPTKHAWRYGEDDSTMVSFLYNDSIPDALDMTIEQPNPDLDISGFLYSTAHAHYDDPAAVASPTSKRELRKRDVWDGPYAQLPWTFRYITVESDRCPSATTFTITFTDANGKQNSTTSGRIDFPSDIVYPLSIEYTSDPDVGSIKATLQDLQPLTYAIANGEGAPSIYAYTYVGAYFCIVPDDD